MGVQCTLGPWLRNFTPSPSHIHIVQPLYYRS